MPFQTPKTQGTSMNPTNPQTPSQTCIQHDWNRAQAILQKIDNLVDQYISVSEPLDLPESSPMHAMTGVGQQGI